MKRVLIWVIAAVVGSVGLMAADDAPRYNEKGELLFPANYREWIFLSSGLAMNYGPLAAHEGEPQFDNVFVAPAAYRSFLETGRWPDKTVFVLEVRASSSKGSINQSGHFQTELEGVEAEVKDETRFPMQWAYFSLGKGDGPGKQFKNSETCFACHAKNGAVDHTFVQFYPTLLKAAQQKGTLK